MKWQRVRLLKWLLLLALITIFFFMFHQWQISLQRERHIAEIQKVASTIEFVVGHAKETAILEGAGDQARSSYSNLPRVYILDQVMELKYGYPEVYADRARGGDLLDLFDVSEELRICYGLDCVIGNSSSIKIGFDVTEEIGCYVKYSEPGDKEAISDKHYGLKIVTEGC